jgi:hypothetical protein
VVERNLAKVDVARSNRVTRFYSVRVPENIRQILKGIPELQDWLRAAIVEKLEREGRYDPSH